MIEPKEYGNIKELLNDAALNEFTEDHKDKIYKKFSEKIIGAKIVSIVRSKANQKSLRVADKIVLDNGKYLYLDTHPLGEPIIRIGDN